MMESSKQSTEKPMLVRNTTIPMIAVSCLAIIGHVELYGIDSICLYDETELSAQIFPIREVEKIDRGKSYGVITT
jgi:hypothetical protein